MKKKTVETKTTKAKTTRKGLVEKPVKPFGGDKEVKALTGIVNIISSLKIGLTEIEFGEMAGRIFNYLSQKYTDEFNNKKAILEYKIQLIKKLEEELESEISKGLNAESIKEQAIKEVGQGSNRC
jgi:hypothetical protein